jgi:hypothetical protein
MSSKHFVVATAATVLGAVACGWLFVGWRRTADGSREAVAEACGAITPENMQEWIRCLDVAYGEGGIESFERARMQLRDKQDTLKQDVDYDVASMVLGLGATSITKKEAELTAQLRALAKSIEERPGEAAPEWMRLRDKLYSYVSGSSFVPEAGSVPVRLSALYEKIAKGRR